MSRDLPRNPSRSQPASAGAWLVVGLMLLGVGAAALGIWFQRQQTRQCLAFYGPEVARRITAAPRVELLVVQQGGVPRLLVEAARLDVSQAPGLVHLRRGLVEDANFRWHDQRDGPAAPEPLPLEAWDAALVFTEPGGRSTLVLDFDDPLAAVAVVGQPGRIRLGRMRAGLETWIHDTWRRDGGQRESGREATATPQKTR